MTGLRTVLLGALVALFTACGSGQGGEDGSNSGTQGALNAGAAPAGELDDNGTELSATAEVTGNTCTSETEAQVTLAGVVSTTGSVDSVIITASIDGEDRIELDTLYPQDFEHDGRNKTAAYEVSVTLPNGTHTVEICFTQSGAQGREPKTTCAPAVTVVVDCAPEQNACAESEPFGDIVGNPSLCKGNGTPHVPVHVRGDFGEEAIISISGPNGFSLTGAMNHAGESCNYHYNWDTQENNHGGTGTYTFTVTGNGQTLTFAAELHCPGAGGNGGDANRRR